MRVPSFKKYKQLYGVGMIALVLTLGCRSSGPKPEEVVAQVGKEEITVAQFQSWLAQERENYPEEFLKNPEQFQKLKERLLQERVDETLLLKQAELEGVTLSSEEIEKELRQYKQQYSEVSFQETLKEKGVDPELWLQQKQQGLKIRKFLKKKLNQGQAVELQQLLDYYEAHAQEFVEPAAVRVRQLVTNQKAKAKRLREKLLKGANFAKMAQDHGLSPDRKRGGDLGFIVKGQVPEEFNICFELKPGEISEVVESPYGFHLFKVLERRSEQQLPFTAVKEKIRIRLQQERQTETREKLLAELRKKYSIKINDEVLKRIR